MFICGEEFLRWVYSLRLDVWIGGMKHLLLLAMSNICNTHLQWGMTFIFRSAGDEVSVM